MKKIDKVEVVTTKPEPRFDTGSLVIEIVSDSPPRRSLEEILRDPPKLALKKVVVDSRTR